ncbi:MAG: hypothetical protein V1933_05375 [Candidatus Omnitrophota bacterium]
MNQFIFIIWLIFSLVLAGFSTICGFKTKDAWDKWHRVSTLPQAMVPQYNKTDVAKLKINRAFEDFDKTFTETVDGFPKKSSVLASQFSARGLARSSIHINAQKELSINTKKDIDKALEELYRRIEDILVELLGKTSLQSSGAAFVAEQKRLEETKNKCQGVYPLLNNSPRDWEQRALGQTGLTKDFDVANVGKDENSK